MRHGADISVTRTYDNYIAALNLSRGIPAIILTILIDNFDHDKGRYGGGYDDDVDGDDDNNYDDDDGHGDEGLGP